MKQKFTEEEKIRFVKDWRESGLTRKKYAEANGLSYYTFRTWQEKEKQTDFVELHYESIKAAESLAFSF